MALKLTSKIHNGLYWQLKLQCPHCPRQFEGHGETQKDARLDGQRKISQHIKKYDEAMAMATKEFSE